MKNILALAIVFLLFSGCIQLPGFVAKEKIENLSEMAKDMLNESKIGEQQCEPFYSVSIPQKGKMGESGAITAKLSCADGKAVSVYVDGNKVEEKIIKGKEENTLSFDVGFERDGKHTVEVMVDRSMVKKADIAIAPLGSNDTSGSKNDAFSIKEYVASGFETKTNITVSSIGLYIKRLYSNTLKNSYVIVEIRKDEKGLPASSALAMTYLPIEKIMMNEKWIWFNFNTSIQLPPGKYWIVLRVDQENSNIVGDVANIYYVSEDSEKPASPFVKRMSLEWNKEKQKYEETQWKPTAYDRTYSILISSEIH